MRQYREQNVTAMCADCDSIINFKEQPFLGDLVICPKCNAQLEVVALSPLRLDSLFEGESYSYDRQFRRTPFP
jgi:lysine biosynthesis protein LysW